ncbi:sigma-70 family RNA polymerase sigma factor [Myroides odoratimimus]|uniref:RNA polymerase subunit sigma-70 n=3 Tax=Myroides odoratimimus TaxID=76832 RepID=A0AAI8C574_9FLAO|nr:RNA polymerase sigma factor, sigma-70 family [Myroides sp. A21]ALU26307.1 RNA polymerase subunit sigma-70 [Myroides odoratimimus]APA92358.1 RNA polymerase subunit sigma-70 [Myroides sp. ZB35]EHO13263.1 sigma-70 family RNA polymerase sigma factor [Myroides odoratimimus CCUG 12901]MDM1034158.1 sigma-70 family RNA polymerase sigma factor [Myroides odoratimimus]
MSKILERTFLDQIEKHKGILYKVSKMYMDNQEDQNDLYQEIVLQLWKSYTRFQGQSQFSTWMYRVALNTAITYFKKAKQVVGRNEAFDEKMKSMQSSEVDMDIESQVHYLYKAIYLLNDVEKALVFLYLEGFSHQDIGRNLGISEGNARVKLNRTKSKLQEIIKDQGYEFR